jgi:hypothetical protein
MPDINVYSNASDDAPIKASLLLYKTGMLIIKAPTDDN